VSLGEIAVHVQDIQSLPFKEAVGTSARSLSRHASQGFAKGKRKEKEKEKATARD
jgi:hypothetical protein